MQVTRFGYSLEKNLVKKIDLMIKRCNQKNPKRDAVMLCEGAEGEGKTTLSIALAYYVSEQTGREFNEKHVYFDLRKMIEYLQSTEEQIAIWDEPALQALSKDAMTSIVKDLERLLMMARKKRHFLFINIAYFNKFSDYIVWQRPLGMCHVYSRNEIEAGRFIYIRKKFLENLMHDWKVKKLRNYRRYGSKYIRGTFPDVLNPEYKHNVLSEFDVQAYEKNKDSAIMLVGNTKKEEDKKDVDILKGKIATIQYPVSSKKEMAEKLGIGLRTIYDWAEKQSKMSLKDGQIAFAPLQNANIINKGYNQLEDGIPEYTEVE